MANLYQYPSFIGPAYLSQSLYFAGERLLDCYVETIGPSGKGGKSPTVILGRPGLTLMCAAGTTGDCLGNFSINGRTFGIVNGEFFEIVRSGTVGAYAYAAVAYGSVGSAQFGAFSLSTNGLQIAMTGGYNAYVFDLTANTLVMVTTPVNFNTIIQIDGYFIGLQTNSNDFYISAYRDGTSWSAIDFAFEEVPDNAVTIIALQRYLWILGQEQVEVYYDSGDANFPFTRIQGAYMEKGAAALFGVSIFDNTIAWLASDVRGNCTAFRAAGYTPQRISNHAVEEQWQTYQTIADAQTYTQVWNGHEFWVVSFPTANKCWVYDAATQSWAEWGNWNAGTGDWDAYIGRFHTFNAAWGIHVVGSWKDNNFYFIDQNNYTDNGQVIRRMRTAPHLWDGGTLAYYGRFQLDMQVGSSITVNGTNGMITTGQNSFLSAFGTFTSSDVGSLITVTGAGAAGGDLITTIAAYVSPTNVLLLANAGTTVTGAVYSYQRAPQVAISWSNDGGYTFNPEVIVGAGRIGEYKARVIVNRCGRARDRVFRVVISDPIPVVLTSAMLQVDEGISW